MYFYEIEYKKLQCKKRSNCTLVDNRYKTTLYKYGIKIYTVKKVQKYLYLYSNLVLSQVVV
jgi:hypothetical protein